MIVNLKDGTFEQQSHRPSENWMGEGWALIDETNEQGKQMVQTYISNFPFVDIVTSGQVVTDIIVLDKPVKPLEVEGKEIKFVKDEAGQWLYEYVDRPLTEIEELKQQLAEQQQLIDAMLGVSE